MLPPPEPITLEDIGVLEDEEASSDETADIMGNTDDADQIIPYLQQANYSVVVAIEHPNSEFGNTDGGSISAYAKMAGKDWTYYIKTTRIQIGRPPDDAAPKPTFPAGFESFGDVHIDLGPGKHVSRLHASVFYNAEDEKWHLSVDGRNGLKLNDTTLRKGDDQPLRSGDVIEISGTEMMFVLADTPAVIHAKFISRLQDPNKHDEVDLRKSNPHAHPESSSRSGEVPSQVISSTQLPIRGAPNTAPAPSQSVRQITPPPRVLPSQDPRVLPSHVGEVMASTNEPINYASDAVKNIRPSCSYATIIAQAILSAPDECLTLSNIYAWIIRNFAYFRHADQSWQVCPLSACVDRSYDSTDSCQNSIRHNLSLNNDFIKIPRRTDEPGKGMKWAIVPERRDALKQAGLKMSGRGGARKPSGPNSPAAKQASPRKSPTKKSPRNDTGSITRPSQTSPTSQTPPLSAYPPSAQESYTPTRGSRRSALSHGNDQPLPVLSDDASPLPTRPHYLSTTAAAAGSPPSLSSSAAYYDEQNPNPNNLYTPAPQRREPKQYAPSSAKLPSMYLPQSSPAPFFKLNGELGSTPAGFGESSPLKESGRLGLRSELASSSPPPMTANGSPTRSKGVSSEFGSGSQNRSISQLGSMNKGLGITHGPPVEDDDTPLDILG